MGALTPAKYEAATLTFSMLFREVLRDTPTYYQQIATEIPSTTREMRHAWLDRIPQMREWLGERVVNNLAVRLQSIENRLFEDTVGVKRTDIEDDLIGAYRPVIEELAQQTKGLAGQADHRRNDRGDERPVLRRPALLRLEPPAEHGRPGERAAVEPARGPRPRCRRARGRHPGD
jgi:hypothetical protein